MGHASSLGTPAVAAKHPQQPQTHKQDSREEGCMKIMHRAEGKPMKKMQNAGQVY
jgi:hypothetical protein